MNVFQRIITRPILARRTRYSASLLVVLLLLSGRVVLAQDDTLTPDGTLPEIIYTAPPPLFMPDSHCGVTAQTDIQVVLVCEPGFASERDQITIIAPTIDPDWTYPTTPTETLPSILEGFWVFDVGADGSANIVIAFSKGANGEAIAEFYADVNGDGQVNIVPNRPGEMLSLAEPPTMRMVAPDGWWVDGDKVNYNLDITIDGKVRGSFGISLVYGRRQWQEVTTDGNNEFEIHVRDTDYDGRPNYEWRQIWLDLAETDGYFRTEITYNTEDDEGLVESYIFWQHLGIYDGRGDYLKTGYGITPPPIDVDWVNSTIPVVGEFVTSRFNAGNYFLYSLLRFVENETSLAAFEVPFGYYNLTGTSSVIPDLLIRNAYMPPNSAFFVDGDTNPETTNPRAFQEIRYAWREPIEQDPSNAPIWDYSLSIGGRHEYDSVVEIPPFSIVIPEYETLPNWVIDKTWDFASLNANEGNQHRDSEARAQWSVLEGVLPLSNLYIMGMVTEPPFARRFTNIEQGVRSEMAPALQQQLWLYIDSFDGKLHLQKVDFGMWRRNVLGILQYRNLNNDPYIDQWSYVEGGTVRQQVTRLGDYMLLEDGDTVRVAYYPQSPSLREGLPPTTGDEIWAWDNAVEAADVGFQPHQMALRFAALDAPTWSITDAELLDVRESATGFESVISIGEDAETSGDLPVELIGEVGTLLALQGLEDGRLILSQLEPPTVSIAAINIGLNAESYTLYDRQRVQIQLLNESLISVDDVQIRVNARQGTTVVPLLDNPLDLPGRATTPISVIWQPTNAGEWQIDVEVDVRWNEEVMTLRDSESITIRLESIDNRVLLDLWGQLPLSGVLQITLLFSGILITVSLLILIYRRISS